MKVIRFIVGKIILFISNLTMPKKGKRSEERQVQIEQQLHKYSIYQFHACPFCVKVRRALKRLNLPIELRDAKTEGEHRQALLAEGGRIQVPCLRIEDSNGTTQWLYESGDIINYLERQYPL